MTDLLLSDLSVVQKRVGAFATVSSLAPGPSTEPVELGWDVVENRYRPNDYRAEWKSAPRIKTGPATFTFTYEASPRQTALEGDVAFIVVDSDITVEAARPAWWDAAEARLSELRNLPADWNGYGAPPLNEAALDRAVNLLAGLVDKSTPEPAIVPAVKGGVQVEWHTMTADLEIEVIPAGSLSVLFTDAATGQDIEPDRVTQEILQSFVKRLGR